MNYQFHYNKLIERAKDRFLNGYSEKHHIIPKCIGGSDNPNNLVRLTAEEHYVAHQLLVKIYPGNKKLIFAAREMTQSVSVNKGQRGNKLYGWLRKEWISTLSVQSTQQMLGKHNGVKTEFKPGHESNLKKTIWITNGTNALRVSKDKKIPIGWYRGMSEIAKNSMRGKHS